MLGSFTGMINKIKDNRLVLDIADNLTSNYAKIRQQVLPAYPATQLLPGLYHIPFPEPENVAHLKAHIAASEFQIWNVSEYQYEKSVEAELLREHEQGSITHLCFSMYSSLPFYELVLALNTIDSFLRSGKGKKVYVHCQDNRVRSAVLLACYLYRQRAGVEDIGEAILLVNKALRVSLEEEGKKKMYRNLHSLFKNFVNYLNNPRIINRQQLRLLKIIISNPPQLHLNHKLFPVSSQLRLCFEVKCGEATVMKNVYEGGLVEGNTLCAPFEKDILLDDEFLVILKYLHEGKAYNILRIQLNTSFIEAGFARVGEQGVDTSSFARLDASSLIQIDLMFEVAKQVSKLGLLSQPGAGDKELKEEAAEVALRVKKRSEEEDKQTLSEAIALLNEATIAEQEVVNAKMVEEMQLKMMEVLKTSQLESSSKEASEEQEQDLDDYLSKLQGQAQ